MILNETSLSDDAATLASYGLSHGANLFMILSKDVSVHVKPVWNHPVFMLQMKPEATVLNLKAKIQERTGWTPRYTLLIHIITGYLFKYTLFFYMYLKYREQMLCVPGENLYDDLALNTVNIVEGTEVIIWKKSS